MDVLQLRLRFRTIGVHETSDQACFGNKFSQQLKPLSGQGTGHDTHASNVAARGEGTLPRATIAATCLWTKSDANVWRRSYRPSAQRYSIATFSCSKKPSSLRP